MVRRTLKIAVLLTLLGSGSVFAGNDNFALYTFMTGPLQDSVAVRLDARTGQSWFFDGETLQPMAEAKVPSRYRNPAYELNPLETSGGTVLLRIDRVSGQLWAYREQRWQPLAP